jgi:hypothetical protein
VEIRKQDRLAARDAPVSVDRRRQLRGVRIDLPRAERASGLALPRERRQVEVVGGHQATLRQDPRALACERVEPNVDHRSNELVRAGLEHLGDTKLPLELHRRHCRRIVSRCQAPRWLPSSSLADACPNRPTGLALA